MQNNLIRKLTPVFFALLAAILFGLNAPLAKLLLKEIDPLFLAALLYLGAGTGMLLVDSLRNLGSETRREARLSTDELPYIILMIILDIAAPISFLLGLRMTNASTAALLGNFEIAATAFFALVLFKEAIGRRLWLAIIMITAASILLSLHDLVDITFSPGALLVLVACLSWGIENNTTRKLSIKDPLQVVILKGFGAGLGALIIAAIWGRIQADLLHILSSLALGFVAYGLSIFFYVRAQRDLGAARTSAYYAAAPFIGMGLSWIMLKEPPSPTFLIALAIMLLGAGLAVSEEHAHTHVHQAMTHEHRHSHTDGHHNHPHAPGFSGEHSHEHTHEELTHEHPHMPDTHHHHDHA